MTLASDRLSPKNGRYARLCALLALGLAARTASADQDACTGFTWNVVRERALFASAPQSVAAGREPGTTPLLAAERLYELKLGQQGQVTDVGQSGISVTDAHGDLLLLALAARLHVQHHLVVTVGQHAALVRAWPGDRPVELEHVVTGRGSGRIGVDDPLAAARHYIVALDGGQHRGRLLAAHHRDTRIRP